MNGLGLCAGIGGIELGLKLALGDYRAVCYVEREAFAAAVLAARIQDGALDAAPIWDDPFSVAGRGLGEADERHLWPHVARVVSECEPSLVFCENVPPHLSRGFDVVTRDLQGLGYRVAAMLLRASDVGAPHKRERLFFLGASVADFHGEGCPPSLGGGDSLSDAERDRLRLEPEGINGKGGEFERPSANTPSLETMARHGALPSLQDPTTPEAGSASFEPSRVLNPRFVEMLMGLPFGWTSFEPLEMPLYQQWLRLHSPLSTASCAGAVREALPVQTEAY